MSLVTNLIVTYGDIFTFIGQLYITMYHDHDNFLYKSGLYQDSHLLNCTTDDFYDSWNFIFPPYL